MNRGHAEKTTRQQLRTLMPVIGLAALIMTGLPTVAAAEGNTQPPRDSQGANPGPAPSLGGVPDAPVGHRQPRPQDLPESIVREEGERSKAQEELDKKLQICKGC